MEYSLTQPSESFVPGLENFHFFPSGAEHPAQALRVYPHHFHRHGPHQGQRPPIEDFIRYAKEIVELSQYLEQRYQARKTIPMRFSVSSQRLPFATHAFTRIFQEMDSQSYDMAIWECDINSVIHDVSTKKSELGVLAIHDAHRKSLQTLFSSCDVCFHEIAAMRNYAFFRAGHPLSEKLSVTLKDLEDYPFVTYDQGLGNSHFSEKPLFYKILSHNVHVCDRSTKIALVRKTDCFSIGPGLTNSNADQFHKGQGEILAKPLEAPLGELHLGYILKKRPDRQPVGSGLSEISGRRRFKLLFLMI